MDSERGRHIKRLLIDLYAGRAGARDELTAAIVDDIRKMAYGLMEREVGGERMWGLSLRPTQLADDTLMRLLKQRQEFDTEFRLFGVAKEIMRFELLNYLDRRSKKPARLQSDFDPPDPKPPDGPAEDDQVRALLSAIEELTQLRSRAADVARMRHLFQMTQKEVAAALGVSLPTVERDWSFAKGWLRREIERRCA